ncbi:tetrathionate reductase subunit A, partial [Pasteurella multocida subsp. multocida str. Anand1_cattle]
MGIMLNLFYLWEHHLCKRVTRSNVKRVNSQNNDTEDNFDYVVVAPRLELSSSRAVNQHRWVPIVPGTDLSLSLAMLRWIIENARYNADY